MCNREDKNVNNFLLISNEEGHLHYYIIRKFSRLLSNQRKISARVIIANNVCRGLVGKISLKNMHYFAISMKIKKSRCPLEVITFYHLLIGIINMINRI